MISLDVLIPLFAAFVVSVVLSPFAIPFLQKLKIGQTAVSYTHLEDTLMKYAKDCPKKAG